MIIPDKLRVLKSVIRAGGRVRRGREVEVDRTTILEKCKTPLDTVNFFDTKDAGVLARTAKEGMQLTSVETESIFAKAGLRVDDLIGAIDGQEVKSSEQFRRVLRRHIARDRYAETRVQRDGKWKTILLPPLR